MSTYRAASGAIAPLVTAALSTYLPGPDSGFKTLAAYQLGSALEPVFASVTQGCGAWVRRVLRLSRNWHTVIVQHGSPVYDKLEEYILAEFIDVFRQCQVVPRKGNVTFAMRQILLDKSLETEFQGHKIVIDIASSLGQQQQHNYRERNDRAAESGRVDIEDLVVGSRTADIRTLREFVTSICEARERQRSRLLKVYRAVVGNSSPRKRKRGNGASGDEDGDGGPSASWDEIEIRTNRNLLNTIVSETVQHELLDDVKWFLDNEEWYNAKGIPYKRGYVLYGPPGTGKTSIVKALANEYDLYVFVVDLAVVRDNSQLTMLISQINYLARNRRYILSIEDIDRSDLLKEKYDRADKDFQITMDCFLQVLDGIVESSGRLLFLSANKLAPLEKIDSGRRSRNNFHNQPNRDAQEDPSALLRPGRVDRLIKLDYCGLGQAQAMLEHFYGEEAQSPESHQRLAACRDCLGKTTPAQLIKLMQESPTECEPVLKALESDTLQGAQSDIASQSDWGNNSFAIRRAITNVQRKQRTLKRRKRKIQQIEREYANLEKLKESTTKMQEDIDKAKQREKAKAAKVKAARTKAARARAAKVKAATAKAARPKAARAKAATARAARPKAAKARSAVTPKKSAKAKVASSMPLIIGTRVLRPRET